jgi:hypothetical protein
MIGAPLLPAQCNRSERVHKALFRTRTEAKEAVFEYTEVFYDRHRLPSALDAPGPRHGLAWRRLPCALRREVVVNRSA